MMNECSVDGGKVKVQRQQVSLRRPSRQIIMRSHSVEAFGGSRRNSSSVEAGSN